MLPAIYHDTMRTAAQSVVRQSWQRSPQSLIIHRTRRPSRLVLMPLRPPPQKSKLKALLFGMARTAHIAWA
jgi:hypothetical protein